MGLVIMFLLSLLKYGKANTFHHLDQRSASYIHFQNSFLYHFGRVSQPIVSESFGVNTVTECLLHT